MRRAKTGLFFVLVVTCFLPGCSFLFDGSNHQGEGDGPETCTNGLDCFDRSDGNVYCVQGSDGTRRCAATCLNNRDCVEHPDGETCSASGQCSCGDNSECPAHQPICGAAGRCEGCADNVDCTADLPICNVASATCVQCVQPGDCRSDGASCIDNQCRFPDSCDSDGDGFERLDEGCAPEGPPDCNDDDPRIYPGALPDCESDSVDESCGAGLFFPLASDFSEFGMSRPVELGDTEDGLERADLFAVLSPGSFGDNAAAVIGYHSGTMMTRQLELVTLDYQAGTLEASSPTAPDVLAAYGRIESSRARSLNGNILFAAAGLVEATGPPPSIRAGLYLNGSRTPLFAEFETSPPYPMRTDTFLFPDLEHGELPAYVYQHVFSGGGGGTDPVELTLEAEIDDPLSGGSWYFGNGDPYLVGAPENIYIRASHGMVVGNSQSGVFLWNVPLGLGQTYFTAASADVDYRGDIVFADDHHIIALPHNDGLELHYLSASCASSTAAAEWERCFNDEVDPAIEGARLPAMSLPALTPMGRSQEVLMVVAGPAPGGFSNEEVVLLRIQGDGDFETVDDFPAIAPIFSSELLETAGEMSVVDVAIDAREVSERQLDILISAAVIDEGGDTGRRRYVAAIARGCR